MQDVTLNSYFNRRKFRGWQISEGFCGDKLSRMGREKLFSFQGINWRQKQEIEENLTFQRFRREKLSRIGQYKKFRVIHSRRFGQKPRNREISFH